LNAVAAGNHRSSVHRVDLPRIVLVGWDILDSLSDVCRELGYSRAMEAECTFVCDATMETVNRVVSDVAEMDVNVVLGVGGGRNIDVAKLAAAKTDTFFISVPTVASHDGIASNLASVKGLKSPYTVKAVSPIAVLMDSKIIAESPYQFTASGCGDIVSKAVEVEDWRLAHRENGDYYGGYAGGP
jgi:glycerol-1-phosphate dehydrogenase [NAD(P)+]